MLRLKIKANRTDSWSEKADVAMPSKGFDITCTCRFVPGYQDRDLDSYCLAFENKNE